MRTLRLFLLYIEKHEKHPIHRSLEIDIIEMSADKLSARRLPIINS
jgi:phosphoribosyl-dephospho-CoA transferase